MLAAIFSVQAVTFSFGILWCGKHGGINVCPEIGKRYEQTFSVMIATTLALLTGVTISKKE
jgi:hypothetical protein